MAPYTANNLMLLQIEDYSLILHLAMWDVKSAKPIRCSLPYLVIDLFGGVWQGHGFLEAFPFLIEFLALRPTVECARNMNICSIGMLPT